MKKLYYKLCSIVNQCNPRFQNRRYNDLLGCLLEVEKFHRRILDDEKERSNDYKKFIIEQKEELKAARETIVELWEGLYDFYTCYLDSNNDKELAIIMKVVFSRAERALLFYNKTDKKYKWFNKVYPIESK